MNGRPTARAAGMSATEYFSEIQKARGSVAIPTDFQAPIKDVMVSPSDVKTKFALANSSIPEDGFRIACSGRYLSEVRVCLTRDLRGRACSADLRDSCPAEVIMRPLR